MDIGVEQAVRRLAHELHGALLVHALLIIVGVAIVVGILVGFHGGATCP